MCTQTPREMPSGAACATRFSCLRLFFSPPLLTSSAPPNARQAESTGYTTWVRSPPPPPVTAPIHTVDIWGFLDLSVAAEVKTSSMRGCRQVCELCCRQWWRIKAGGCAAWCTPSCCCSHSVVFAELCVIPFTYSLRIFFSYGPRCFLWLHEMHGMSFAAKGPLEDKRAKYVVHHFDLLDS